jgi:hypothetical protein
MKTLVAVLFGLTLATAQPPRGWTLLGDLSVDGAADHDRIQVAEPATYRTIRLRVENAPVLFQRLIVHFAGGPDEPMELRARVPVKTDTRDLNLPDNRGEVISVEFWYERQQVSRDAPAPRVLLFGRR